MGVDKAKTGIKQNVSSDSDGVLECFVCQTRFSRSRKSCLESGFELSQHQDQELPNEAECSFLESAYEDFVDAGETGRVGGKGHRERTWNWSTQRSTYYNLYISLTGCMIPCVIP